MRSIFKPYSLKLAGFIVSCGLLLSGSACKKATTCNGVPNVSVNFTVSLSSASSAQLSTVGYSEIFSGGYDNDGVLIYHYTQNQFLSYDCTCPYDGQSNAKAIVSVNSSNPLYAQCPVCGSTFLLSTGSPSKGPSQCPLKAYSTSYDNTSNTIYVSN